MSATSQPDFAASRSLRLLDKVTGAYRHVFAASRAAPLLSQPNPVRRTGFEHEVIVGAVRDEADGVVALTLTAPYGGKLPRWVPGAHIDVLLPSGLQRQYSLCGDPDDRCHYRIAVRRIESGGGSREIHDTLQAGDRLRIRGPRNAFRLVQADSYLFVAGGIGITPILPMVRACHERGLPWQLVYLGRNRAGMPFLDELAGYDSGVVEIRPDDEYDTAVLEPALASARAGAAVYLCGPPPLMSGARRTIRAINPTASVHTERFSALPVENGAPFEVRLARTGATVPVSAQETALTAVRRAVPGVAYSCQQGFCGTCRTRVLAGEVDHRDRLLTETERENSMLICVSRAAGSNLELDL